MLTFVNISNSVWQESNYLHQTEACLSESIFSQAAYNRSVIGMNICGWLSGALFSAAHWMFAYKYWVMSFKIKALIDGNSMPDLKC